MKVQKELISTSFVLLQIVNVFAIRISEKKCQAYDQSVDPLKWNSMDGLNVHASEIANPKEFPFLAKVYLGNSTENRYYNGILISENFVLTVGYYNITNGTYVVVGDYVYRTDIRQQRLNVIQHFKSDKDQLALLKLNVTVKFNQYIRPICLFQPKSNVSQSLIEIGWGINDVLRIEKWNLLANYYCNETHTQGADKSRICASKVKSDCEDWFDIVKVQQLYVEGCALLNDHNRTSSRNELVGIKLRTKDCNCGMGHPEEFARISTHIDWIEKLVWPSNSATETYLSFHFNIVALLIAFVNCFYQF